MRFVQFLFFRHALEQYLSFQYAPLEETFFKGIYKLMPGHMLLYKNGNYEIKTYFKTKLTPGKWNRKTNMDQLRSQLAEILKDSVKHHMLSDVEVGAFYPGEWTPGIWLLPPAQIRHSQWDLMRETDIVK